MQPLTEKEFQDKCKEVYELLFTGSDAYSTPFQKNIQPRLLLYNFGYELSEPWLSPVIKTMKELGEKGFYVSLQGEPLSQDQSISFHWYVPVEEIKDYGKKIFPLENRIYSVNGIWGIICSEEGHAILGGPDRLVNSILRTVDDMDIRIHNFISMWKHYHNQTNVNIDWLYPMLSHIFGENAAKSLLSQNDLKWLINDSERT